MAFLAIFRSRRMAILFLLGFSSGLPLLLTGQLLTAWLTKEGVSLAGIAAYSVVGLGYTFKFAWAPLLDRYQLPFLGRRRGWAVVSQLGLMVVIITMGFMDPVEHTVLLAIMAAIVAVLSATQDVVVDAYSVDLLRPEERAAGSAIYVIGYRIALLLTGTVGLFMAEFVPWSVIYGVSGALMLVGVFATIAAEEPPAPKQSTTLFQAIYVPFVDLLKRLGPRGMATVLIFVALYKFGDFFQDVLLFTFFIRGLHFDLTEIALVYKLTAFAGIFIGGFLGGTMVARFGLVRMLVVFGILDAATSLLYSLAATQGRDFAVFGTAVFVHNLTGAMGTSAFVGFLMSICNKRVSATQMALLTSLTSVGKRIFGPFASDVVASFDPDGLRRLVDHHVTIQELTRPAFEAAAMQLRWSELPDLVAYQGWLDKFTNPAGSTVVSSYDWVWFFAVTAMMAIPGILLALVVRRYKVAPPEPAP